ncbi:MAG: hypothetical protein KGZ61_01725 [Sandarakinorhabdus sp.]|nr:hypothetical protein [Sandarakinorhabdus sp.]
MAATDQVKRLLGDRRGAIALIFAASTPVIVGSVGLAVDTIQWTTAKRQIQRQADSGAIAGAYGLAQSANVRATVTSDIAKNNFVDLATAPVIENAPTVGPFAGNARAVRVALAAEMRLPFSSILMTEPVRISAEATAALVSNGEYCAISLESGNTTGINMTGNATIDLNCGMATNSVSANSVSAGGSSRITASPIMGVGGLRPSSNYGPGTVLIPYGVPQPDPFAALPGTFPLGSNQNGNVGSNQTRTLNPGTYNNFRLQGNVTLNPGIYYLNGTDFDVGSQARVSGSGVVIILTGSGPANIGQANINGGATINLTAPTTGTYAGVLFYQDRRAPATNQTNKMNGNSTSTFRGAMYFPNQELQFNGTTGMNTNCIQLVARRLTFTGNSTVSNVCPSGSGSRAFLGTAVRLVG